MSIDNIEKFEKPEEKIEENTSKKEAFESLDLDFFSDISMHISVEVGKIQKIFAEVLKLKEGDIIKLDKNVEDYMDIYLNGLPFAIGEMVVINDKYGVRVIDLV